MHQGRIKGPTAGVTEAASTGAILAATIAAVIALAAGRLQAEPWRPFGSVVVDPGGLASAAIMGAPIVAWLGNRLADKAAGGTWTEALVRAIWMAVLAVVLGSVATVLVAVALELPGSNVGWEALILLPYLVAAPIVGIVFFGPLAIAVTLPAAIVWVVILRMLVRPPGPPGPEPSLAPRPTRTREEAPGRATRQDDSPGDPNRPPAADPGRGTAVTASRRV
jgi:hypothetical protein